MSTKMKGLLKGLRYISQIFENEKEEEMVIGLPTDVKHVAHIGWDGPSVNSPSWMNEFKSSPADSSSAASGFAGLIGDATNDGSVRSATSDGSSRRGAASGQESPARDLPEAPKSSKKSSSGDSPSKSKSEKSKSRRSSTKGSTARDMPDSSTGTESPRKSKLPDIPKKSRRKKSKDSSEKGGSSRSSRSKNQSQAQTQPSSNYEAAFSDVGSEFGSGTLSMLKNTDLQPLSPREEGDK